MLFPTIKFAIFFALVFPVTWLLNEHNTAKKWFLVAASYFFYASWNAGYTLILFGSSLLNFVLALALGRLADGVARRALFCAASPAISACSATSNTMISSWPRR